MAQCAVCNKARAVGNNVSHANNKTKRVVHPNLQRIKVSVGGRVRRVNVCTRCVRSGRIEKSL